MATRTFDDPHPFVPPGASPPAGLCHAGCPQALAALQELGEGWRDISVSRAAGTPGKCDDATAGWSTLGAGRRMPSVAPGSGKCGTTEAGWLATPHPPRGAAPTPSTVCFDADAAGFLDCFRSVPVEVCACSYDGGATTTLSYKLSALSRCYAAYCATDEDWQLPPPPPEAVADEFKAPYVPTPMPRRCYVSVFVKDADFAAPDQYVTSTTANGEPVHGPCGPRLNGATVGGRGFFECASRVPLPHTGPLGRYHFKTTATEQVVAACLKYSAT